MLTRTLQKPSMGLLSMSRICHPWPKRDLFGTTSRGPQNPVNVLSRPTFIHGLATMQANTDRQMPSTLRQRRTPVSHDTANLTIRV